MTSECRRHAPIGTLIVQQNGQPPIAAGYFPMTKKQHWCLEWVNDKPEKTP
jgi:hypothetical protein